MTEPTDEACARCGATDAHVCRGLPHDDLADLDELAARSMRARYGRHRGQPQWLVEREDGDGLAMLGHGLDDEP